MSSETTWPVGALAVKPHHGIVRIAAHRPSAGELYLVIEPVQVFAPLNLTMFPARAAAEQLIALLDRDDAARLKQRLRTPVASTVPGRPEQRRARCERTLRFGDVERHRAALHQLYAEPHRPDRQDLAAIEALETLVVGELAAVLDRPYQAMRDHLRAAHRRFGSDAVATPSDPGEQRVFVTGDALRAWGGQDDEVLAPARPGTWHDVERDDYYGIVVHQDHLDEIDRLLERAVELGEVSTEGGTVAVVDAARSSDPQIDDELYDPIDGSLYSRGAWWRTGGDGAFPVCGAEHDGALVLLAYPREPDAEDDSD